jgi:hypothetical protein
MTEVGTDAFEARMRASFNRQKVMQTLGVTIERAGAGERRAQAPAPHSKIDIS